MDNEHIVQCTSNFPSLMFEGGGDGHPTLPRENQGFKILGSFPNPRIPLTEKIYAILNHKMTVDIGKINLWTPL